MENQQVVHHHHHAPARHKGKSKTTAIILALFLGGIGGHKFYLDQGGQGILYLLFCWTWIPMLISIVEIVMLAVMSEETFDARFNY